MPYALITARLAPVGPTLGLGTLVANNLYVAEIDVIASTVFTGITVYNGATVSGNVIVALYGADGTQLAASASTAQAGVSQAQRIAFATPFSASSGRGLVALIPSSSIATFALQSSFGLASITAQGGFTIPASITAPTTTGAVVPALGTY